MLVRTKTYFFNIFWNKNHPWNKLVLQLWIYEGVAYSLRIINKTRRYLEHKSIIIHVRKCCSSLYWPLFTRQCCPHIFVGHKLSRRRRNRRSKITPRCQKKASKHQRRASGNTSAFWWYMNESSANKHNYMQPWLEGFKFDALGSNMIIFISVRRIGRHGGYIYLDMWKTVWHGYYTPPFLWFKKMFRLRKREVYSPPKQKKSPVHQKILLRIILIPMIGIGI